MIRSSEVQLCTTQNRPVKFQVEKEWHQGLQLERVRKYCEERCPLKPSCEQAEQCKLIRK